MFRARLIGIVLLVGLVCTLASCNGLSEASPDRQRAARAVQAKGDIVIGAVMPWKDKKHLYRQGMDMAADEVNAAGGVLGRKLSLVWEDDEGVVDKGRLIAQEFANNLDMVAVIGHQTSAVSLPVSAIYEFSGMVMLTPTATTPQLTQRGYKRIFRNIPTDEQIGRQLADYAVSLGLRQVMSCYVRNVYGRGLSNAFTIRAAERQISIVDEESYDGGTNSDSLRSILRNWRDSYTFEGIFLAGALPLGAQFVVQARNLGIKAPIIGGDALHNHDLIKMAGQSAEGVVVASTFAPGHTIKEVQQFVRAFKQRFGYQPNHEAAEGYDAIKLLAHAMTQAGSSVPDQIVDALHAVSKWPGVTGLTTFSENGDVVGKSIILKVIRNGKFQFLDEDRDMDGNFDLTVKRRSQGKK